MMLTKSAQSFSKVAKNSTRYFASRNSSGGNRGPSENTSSSTSQTSNAPNYGTSNNSGGRFSGSPNQNIQGASNTTSPASSSKATSTSGTSQATGTGSSTLNKKGGPQPQDDSSIANNKAAKDSGRDASGGFANFFKNAFGGSGEGSTESMSTESSNPNRPSIPKNDLNTYTKDTGKDSSVKASPQDRSSGSVGASASSGSSSASSGSSGSGSSKAPSRGGAQVNRETIGDVYSIGAGAADYQRARSELQFDNVGTRYAYLLWSMYKEQNALPNLERDLEKFYGLAGEDENLATVFEQNELMTERNRETALDKFLEKGGLDEKLEAFLRTVAEMRRLSDLRSIFNSLHEVVERVEKGVHTAIVASAKPLTAGEKESIRKTIELTFKPQGEVEILEELKPELGGGYEIYYDGKYHLDNSQKTLIAELEDDIDSAITSFINKPGN